VLARCGRCGFAPAIAQLDGLQRALRSQMPANEGRPVSRIPTSAWRLFSGCIAKRSGRPAPASPGGRRQREAVRNGSYSTTAPGRSATRLLGP
jgi:hypothetical protein